MASSCTLVVRIYPLQPCPVHCIAGGRPSRQVHSFLAKFGLKPVRLLSVVGKRLLQPIQFFLGDGDDRAVAWGEETLCGGVLYAGELLEVLAHAELVVATRVAVVHEYPVALDALEHAGALYGLVGIFKGTGQQGPLLGVVQALGQVLADALLALSLGFEEDVVGALLVLHDVGVDGGALVVEQYLRLALQVAEVLVGISPEHLVVGAAVVFGQDGEVHHVLLDLTVVDGLRCPYTYGTAEHSASVLLGEVYGVVLPLDHVLAAHEHDAPVGTPALAGTHVGNHHVEPAVLATQDMRVAHAFLERDEVGRDDGLAVVQRGVVEAVVAGGVTNLLLFGGITREVGEEIGHFLLAVAGGGSHDEREGQDTPE